MRLRLFAALVALAFAPAASAQRVPASPAVNFSVAAVMPGSWTYQVVAGGSEARFTDSTGTARLLLQCVRATRRMSVSVTSTAPSPSLFVWTSSASRSLPTRFDANATRVIADLAASDGLLDAIAFSRGRVAVTLSGGGSVLVVPAWPEAARTIEDCRN